LRTLSKCDKGQNLQRFLSISKAQKVKLFYNSFGHLKMSLKGTDNNNFALACNKKLFAHKQDAQYVQTSNNA
jgi:hypothetical protein